MNKDNQYGYPQDQGGYPPGYGQQQGYSQQGYPSPQGYPQQGYPQQSGYPPQQGYAQNDYNSGYSASPQQYPPQPSHASPNYDQPIQQLIPSNNEKFKPAPRFNDIWAAILYFVVLAGFIVSAVIYVRGFNIRNISNEKVFGNNLDIYLYPILAGGIASLIFSAVYLFLMQTFPGFLIRVSFWFSAAMYFVTAALFFRAGGTMNIVFAILSIIGGVIYIFLWFSWRHKIPFATLMLKNVSKFVTNYWGTIISTIAFLIVSFGFYIVWVITAGAVLSASSDQQNCTTDRSGRQRCSLPAKYYVFYVYLVFVLFWTTQLIRDLSHMTVSGAFGSHYFFPNGGKFTTLASAGRALSTSFGSGCFGSLIVAAIRTLRFLASQLRQSDNGWLAILGCCLECFIGMIEGLVDYFNTYAYTYCAMYGKAYLDAGKATWNLIKDRGVEAIINDNLVGNVLGMGGFLIAGIGALVGFLFITIKGSTGPNPANQQLEVVITVVLINFLVGNVLFGIISSIVDSANVSFFVCLAEDPQALAATNPELFEKIRQTYPEVVQSV